MSESILTDDGRPLIMTDEFVGIEVLHRSQSGYAVVYRAQRMGKWFALKGLKPEFRGKPLYEALLKKEFDIGYHLSHPNVAQTFSLEDVGTLGECIVMEYVDGCTLRKFIDDGMMDGAALASVANQTLDALGYLHAHQVAHRDLKPENILIAGNGRNVKLIDFGFSDKDDYAVLKQPAGTMLYCAPEVMEGKPVDGRADIYSLGVIMKEMATRCRLSPFDKRRLNAIATRCTAADASKRFSSADEIRRAWPRRHDWLKAAAMLTAAFALSALCYVAFTAKPVGNETVAPPIKAEAAKRTESTKGQDENMAEAANGNKAQTTNNGKSPAEAAKNDAMKKLKGEIRAKTLALISGVYAQLGDTTIPKKKRLEAYDNSYFAAERMARAEVDKRISPSSPDYDRLQSEMHEAMRLTFKQYNIDNSERLISLLDKIRKE